MQVLLRSEVNEWKVRVEEEQEKTKTVSGVNSILRQERDQLRQVCHPIAVHDEVI